MSVGHRSNTVDVYLQKSAYWSKSLVESPIPIPLSLSALIILLLQIVTATKNEQNKDLIFFKYLLQQKFCPHKLASRISGAEIAAQSENQWQKVQLIIY